MTELEHRKIIETDTLLLAETLLDRYWVEQLKTMPRGKDGWGNFGEKDVPKLEEELRCIGLVMNKSYAVHKKEWLADDRRTVKKVTYSIECIK